MNEREGEFTFAKKIRKFSNNSNIQKQDNRQGQFLWSEHSLFAWRTTVMQYIIKYSLLWLMFTQSCQHLIILSII